MPQSLRLAHNALRKEMNILFKIFKWVLIAFFASSVLAVIIYRFLPVYITPLMVIRGVENVSDGKSPFWSHTWVPLEEMSPYLPVAVIASEDQKFLSHSGFDTEAIVDAVEERMEGRRIRGGSTISQQTAKNVFLWPTSSWVRKGFEVYFTFLIEHLWSKERIMEVYLNSIEMGESIYGAEAVAQEHFSCSASELRRADCALIAATLPNPRKYSSKTPSAYMQRRSLAIQKQMKHIPLFKATQE